MKLKLLVVFILILSETIGRVGVTFTQPVETLPILLVMRSRFWKVEDIRYLRRRAGFLRKERGIGKISLHGHSRDLVRFKNRSHSTPLGISRVGPARKSSLFGHIIDRMIAALLTTNRAFFEWIRPCVDCKRQVLIDNATSARKPETFVAIIVISTATVRRKKNR